MTTASTSFPPLIAATGRSGREAKPDALELLGHPRADGLQGGRRADHHLELDDAAVLVERELVDPLDLLAVHLGGELEDRDAVVRVLELVDVVEAATEQHALRRLQDLQDLIASLVRLEQDRAPEDGVLVEEVRDVS